MSIHITSPMLPFSWGRWVQEKKNQVTNKVFSAFIENIAKPCENYLIHCWSPERKSLTWNPDGNFSTLKYGPFKLGRIIVWRPTSKLALSNGMNKLDKQLRARDVYRAPENLIGSSPFLLADTSALATLHRSAMLKFSNPHQYAEITWELFQNKKGLSLFARFEHSQAVAMKAVAKGLFDIEGASLDKHITILNNLNNDFKYYSQLPISIDILKHTFSFREKQKKYQQAIEDLLEEEIEKIKKRLEAGEACVGMFAEEVRQKIRLNPDVKNLHQDSDLKSHILIMLGIDNLNQALNSLCMLLSSEVSLLEPLALEIEQAGVIQHGNKLESFILMDKRQMPALDKLYWRCLDLFSDEAISVRYVESEMELEGHKIPARSYLGIMSPLEKLEEGNSAKVSPSSVFSEGTRKCPGRSIAEAIFKTIAVGHIIDIMETKKAERKIEENWHIKECEWFAQSFRFALSTILWRSTTIPLQQAVQEGLFEIETIKKIYNIPLKIKEIYDQKLDEAIQEVTNGYWGSTEELRSQIKKIASELKPSLPFTTV